MFFFVKAPAKRRMSPLYCNAKESSFVFYPRLLSTVFFFKKKRLTFVYIKFVMNEQCASMKEKNILIGRQLNSFSTKLITDLIVASDVRSSPSFYLYLKNSFSYIHIYSTAATDISLLLLLLLLLIPPQSLPPADQLAMLLFLLFLLPPAAFAKVQIHLVL